MNRFTNNRSLEGENMSKKEETVEKVEKNSSFSKSSIMISKRYAEKRDVLSFLLKDDEFYTLEQVDELYDQFMKGQVK